MDYNLVCTSSSSQTSHTYLIPVESDTHVEKALKRVMFNNLSDRYTGGTRVTFKQSIVPGPTF